MTAAYKTKIRMTQQYHQAMQLKHVNHETLKALYDVDPSESDDRPVRPPNYTEIIKNMPTMSTEWKTLPFAIPLTEENRQKIEKINAILTFSLRQQKEEKISDNAGFIVMLMSRCLSAVGFDNHVVSGYRHIHGESIPHIWLVIEGYVIENTYVKDLQDHSTDYLCKNTPQCYESCDFSHTDPLKQNVDLDTTIDTSEIMNSIKKTRVNFYIRKPDRALALDLNREQSFNYYFALIRHMYYIYGVCSIGIDPKIRFMCWWCERFPRLGTNFLSDIVRPCDFKETDTSSKTTWKFLHCSRCMVANYCSLECQKADWDDNHIISCFSRGSVYLSPLADISMS